MSAKAVVPVRTSSTVASAPLLQGLNLFVYIRAVSQQEWSGWLLHAFYQSALGTRLLCLCLSNCLAKVDSTTVFCKRIVSTTRQRFAVAYMSCSLDSATLLDQKTTVGNAGAGKNVCFACMLTLIAYCFGKLHIRVFWAAL